MVYGVIMAGGKGTRLWPEGRKRWPKQLLTLLDERPMIRTAVERLAPLIPPERQLIVTTREYAADIANALPDFPRGNILAEPEGKDTAPCIGWAAVKVLERDPSGVIAVVTADHGITDMAAFLRVLDAAQEVATDEQVVVTIGLVPTRPDTGLGYVRYGEPARTANGLEVYHVERFVEKPSEDRAREYLADGHYLWNSGMFILRAAYVIELFERYLPKHYDLLARILAALGTSLEEEVTRDAYRRFERISIDYGIMEKADSVVVIPGTFGWYDMGTWPALDQVRAGDEQGNITSGDHVGIDTSNCIIRSNGRLIATIGVRDMVIIETPAAVLVCPKDQAQRVKDIVKRLEETGRDDVL